MRYTISIAYISFSIWQWTYVLLLALSSLSSVVSSPFSSLLSLFFLSFTLFYFFFFYLVFITGGDRGTVQNNFNNRDDRDRRNSGGGGGGTQFALKNKRLYDLIIALYFLFQFVLYVSLTVPSHCLHCLHLLTVSTPVHSPLLSYLQSLLLFIHSPHSTLLTPLSTPRLSIPLPFILLLFTHR